MCRFYEHPVTNLFKKACVSRQKGKIQALQEA